MVCCGEDRNARLNSGSAPRPRARSDFAGTSNTMPRYVTTAMGIAMSLLLHYTSLGREMRALADNRSLARVIGVPVERVYILTWILAGGLAGVGVA